VQSADALSKKPPTGLSKDVTKILASRAGAVCSFDGTDRIDRQFVTHMLGGSQQQVYWLTEAMDRLTTAINQAPTRFPVEASVKEGNHAKEN
jgi:hypothetical protein